MRRRAALLTALVLLPAPAAAQDSVVAAGTRVRLVAWHASVGKPETLQGTVAEWRGDTLVLRVNPGLVTDVPLTSVRALAVSRGRGPDPLGGAGKGALAGAGFGFLLLLTACGEEDIDPGPGEGDAGTCSLSDAGAIVVLTGALAVVGGVAGLVAGTIVGAERWRPVPLTIRMSVRPLHGGAVGVGFALTL